MAEKAPDYHEDDDDALADRRPERQHLDEKRQQQEVEKERRAIDNVKPRVFSEKAAPRFEHEDFIAEVCIRNRDDIADGQRGDVMYFEGEVQEGHEHRIAEEGVPAASRQEF